MLSSSFFGHRPGWARFCLLFAGASCLALTAAPAQQKKTDLLRIGSSGSLTSSSSNVKEADALETLRSFIKEETGMENSIVNEKGWQAVADKLKKQQLQIGIFQGFEFAWAQEKDP